MRGLMLGAAVLVTAACSAGEPTGQDDGDPEDIMPSNVAPPAVTGAAQQGQTLASSAGSWNGTAPISYAYQWRRCGADGAACALIGGATGTTYALTELDVGATLRTTVTATNAAGSASMQSSQTAVVTGTTPPPPPPPPDPTCPTLESPPPGYCTGQVHVVTPASPSIPALAAGDVVVFDSGTYTDTDGDGTAVRIQQGGTAAKYVTFVSRTRWGAKIDGQGNTARYGFEFGAASYVHIEAFDIHGFGSSYEGNVAAPSASGVMLQAGGAYSRIVGNHIHHISNFCNPTIRAQTGIFIQKGNVLVERNVVHDVGRYDPGENGCTYAGSFNKYKNSDTDIYLQSPGHSNITIRNNLLYNHRNGWGVYIYHGGPENVKILNNTFAFGNPYWSNTHIFSDADIVSLEIRNNVFYDPVGGYVLAWDLEPVSNFVISHNASNQQLLISGANGAPVTTLPPGMSQHDNKWGVDLELADAGAYDFHLLAGSPAIDMGMAHGDVTHDFDHRPRPAGAGFDAGAYEYR
jgi:hypothetical protein